MTPDKVFEAFVPGHGALVRQILVSLLIVPAGDLKTAIERIETETAIGPLLNPSAYTDGRRFENALVYTAILKSLLALRLELQKHDPLADWRGE